MKKRILFVVIMALVLVAFMPASVFAQQITISEDYDHDDCIEYQIRYCTKCNAAFVREKKTPLDHLRKGSL